MPTRLSVVLSTFNRAASLRGAVEALLRQSAAPGSFEIIIVDNNSTDGTGDVIRALARPHLRLVEEPRQGLSYARNAGIDAARGDLIAFTDDDVEAAPDWVERLIATFADVPSADGVGGRVLPAWITPPPPWLTPAHWAPLALQDHGPERRTFSRAAPLGLVGSNFAFRRDVFTRIGRFDPDVQRVGDGVGSTEDHQFLLRLYSSGGTMVYDPQAVVLARVQPERCRRAYHRRWHAGHGRFHARMHDPVTERSRRIVLGVPGHLIRSLAGDLITGATALMTADREAAFAAGLRLRFAGSFIRERLRQRREAAVPARRPDPPPAQAGIVSVVIPSYNHGRFLASALRSLDPGRWTLDAIVVDDGSTDDTAAVAAGFPEVRCIRQPNRGLAAARNRGLEAARGEFVVFLDADDALLPDAIDIGAGALRAHPECALVFGRCVMMDEAGRLLPTPVLQPIEGDAHAAFLRTNPIWMPGMAMLRRDAVLRVGGFAAGFDAAADYDLYLRLTREAGACDHARPVAAYRRHGTNMSGNAARMLRETLVVLRRHRPAPGSQAAERHEAWREGLRRWKDFYGTHLVEEIRAHKRQGAAAAMIRKALTLAWRHPGLAGRELWRKLRRSGRAGDPGG